MAEPNLKHHFHFKHTHFKLSLILTLSHIFATINSLSTSSDTGQLLNNCPTLTAELNDPSTGVFTGKAIRTSKLNLAISRDDGFTEEPVSPSVINYHTVVRYIPGLYFCTFVLLYLAFVFSLTFYLYLAFLTKYIRKDWAWFYFWRTWRTWLTWLAWRTWITWMAWPGLRSLRT